MKISLYILLLSGLVIYLGCRDPFSGVWLRSVADDMNKKIPQYNNDSSMRLDSVIILDYHTVLYKRTLLKNKNWKSIVRNMENVMIDSMKFSSSMKAFREDQISTIEEFRDTRKNLIFSIEITPDKYKD